MSAPDSANTPARENKRDSERLQIPGDLTGEIMTFQPMTVREISRGGAQVETAFPLQINSLHDVRLTLGSRSIVIKGRVVHCRISDLEEEQVVYRSGLEFVELTPRTSEVIAAFLSAMQDAQRPR